jgi:putative ABC transport system permease protein
MSPSRRARADGVRARTVTILSLKMPRRFLRRGTLRLLLTVFAVACGVALVCAIDLANRAVFSAFTEIVDTMAGRAGLQVSSGEGSLFPEEIAKRVGTVEGVELAVPVVSASAFTTDGSGELLTVHGVDITDDAAVRIYEPAGSHDAELEDPLAFLAQSDSVMITEEFASRRRLAVDDAIVLDTPTGRRRFVVRALLAAKGIARVQGGNLIVMDIGAAERSFTQPGLVNRVDIVVKRDADVGRVSAAVRSALPPGLEVETPVQRKANLQKVMRSIQTLMRFVGLLGIVAAFLIAFSRLTTVFETRMTQLAILRACGVRRHRVWWELPKESALVGLIGVIVGIPIGIGLGRALLPIIATTTALSSKTIIANATLALRPRSMLLAAVVGVGAVVLAALVPARRAAAVPILETLRHRGVEMAPRMDRGRWRVTTMLIGVILVLAVSRLSRDAVVSGFVWSAFLVVAAAVLTGPAVDLIAGPVARVARLLGPAGRLAGGTLVRNPRRTALAVVTLGIGLGTVLWVWTLARSFEQSVVEVMPGVLRGDLAVSSSNIGAGYVEAPMQEEIVRRISGLPGVAAAIGHQITDWHYRGGPVALNAFDSSYFDGPNFGRWSLVEGDVSDVLDRVAGGGAVIVSENLVRHLGVQVGDTMTLDSPGGPLDLEIAGVTRDFLSPRGTIEMSREVYRSHWQDDQVVQVLVKVGPGVDLDAVRATVARELGQTHALRILTIRELVSWFAEQVRRAFVGLHLLGGLVLLVVLVGIGDALAASTMERTRELGMVRAIGLRGRVVARAVLVEGVIIGALGLVLAWALGLALGVLWVTSTFPALLGWTLSLHVPWTECLMAGVAGMIVCMLAAYVPAARARRLDPAEALRAE